MWGRHAGMGRCSMGAMSCRQGGFHLNRKPWHSDKGPGGRGPPKQPPRAVAGSPDDGHRSSGIPLFLLASVTTMGKLMAGQQPDDALLYRSALRESGDRISVRAAFRDSTVLLTGVTGFLGTVLLHRLLVVCPEVRRVYVVVRPRGGDSPQARVDRLFQQLLFKPEWLPMTLGEARRKVVVLPGDITLPNLGLGKADLARVRAHVHHVIHAAADIGFEREVAWSLAHNHEGVKNVAALAQSCKHVKGLCHVSSTYVTGGSSPTKPAQEALVTWTTPEGLPADAEALALELKRLPPSRSSRRVKELLQAAQLPFTYCLTKWMGECTAAGAHSSSTLPVAIVRPSLVGGIARGPPPEAQGFVSNAAGAASIALAYGTGIATFTTHEPEAVVDLIPADVAASTVLVAAAAISQGRRGPDRGPLIVHAASSTTNPLTNEAFYRAMQLHFLSQPAQHRFLLGDYPAYLPNVVRPGTLRCFLRFAAGDVKFAILGAALKLMRQRRLALKLSRGWQGWKLYNGRHVLGLNPRFETVVLHDLADALAPDEHALLPVMWEAPLHAWEPYLASWLTFLSHRYLAPKLPSSSPSAPRPAINDRPSSSVATSHALHARPVAV
eukprot:jgi/Botrbrau1/536/Bobra.0010s0011.1